MRPGPRNLVTDVAGLRVGQAGDDRLKSGVTVLVGDAPFVAAVDVMGGAPGTRETDLLAPERLVGGVDALVLAGGSAYGLDAASGVVDGLRAAGHGFRVGGAVVPIVPAAILFDLANGGDKAWRENPYRALGAAALADARRDFALGSAGAGTGALTATLKGGLGSASFVLGGGATVGALVAVNAFGSAVTQDGASFWAAPFEVGDEFGGRPVSARRFDAALPLPRKPGGLAPGANTTIAIVATDADLSKAEAKRLAEAAQDGLARALVPAHTAHDGDLVFAAATAARPLGADRGAALLELGHAAALCLARAIARGVHAARPAPGDLMRCWSQAAD